MRFEHAPQIRSTYPELVAGTITVDGVDADADVTTAVARHLATARVRLAGGTEASFPEIQAWRRVFARMGLPPTRYRCAAESLLRRFRRDGALPRLHPLVDLCNAVSLAYAIPIAVLDVERIDGDLEVRPARGDEEYLTLAGDPEHPEPGEVIFADGAGRAHSRRWTSRQSGWSAIRATSRSVLIVVEGVHARAATDVPHLLDTLVVELADGWSVWGRAALLPTVGGVLSAAGRTAPAPAAPPP
ncbi:B3/B4 domain-containing protein [Micromonospora sp. CA-111912]|uniref:B3/B4 domain-containing protein n=1 Tax=Micromonospora sp. CA-111912 TaxID=3239955 RepID=UPI003D8EE3A2